MFVQLLHLLVKNMDLDDRQITHDQKKDIFDGKLPCVIYMTPENFLSRESWIKGMEKHISSDCD